MRKLQKENRAGIGWAIEEMHTANLGDERLNRRLGNLLEMLSRKPTESIPAASRGWSETKAAYRFFDHDKVTLEKILQPHKEATIERMRAQPVILLPQDTTELDYSSKPEKKGIGKLSYENRLGMLVHPTIAVTPDRVCLGVVNCEIWVREKFKKKDERDKLRKALSIEDKESMRWLNGYRVAQILAEKLPETKIVSISDREGDIYEIFVEATG